MLARRRALLGAVAVAALLAGGSIAEAATSSSAKTKLTVDTVVSDEDQTLFALGELKSGKRVCVGNRKVKIELLPTVGKPVLFDIARSSDIGGGWMGSSPIADVIDFGPFSAARVSTAKKTRRVGKHKRVVCKAAKVVYPLND